MKPGEKNLVHMQSAVDHAKPQILKLVEGMTGEIDHVFTAWAILHQIWVYYGCERKNLPFEDIEMRDMVADYMEREEKLGRVLINKPE